MVIHLTEGCIEKRSSLIHFLVNDPDAGTPAGAQAREREGHHSCSTIVVIYTITYTKSPAMYTEGTQVSDSEKGSGSTFTQWKVTITIAYFIIDDSSLLIFLTFRNTIPPATCLCLRLEK